MLEYAEKKGDYMEIYVKGEKIVLPNKECGKGSEGKAYLYNDKIYKIYYTNGIW